MTVEAAPAATGSLAAEGGAADRAPRRFRPDIEGLRAVAVLAVVLYHAALWPVRGGYVGVDVFFVISGFLITRQLLGELEARGRISFAAFYARRARRLLPAAALVTVATLVAAWQLLPPVRAKAVSGDALAAALFGINYRLAAQGTDYLTAGAPPSPLQHYWSLAVEEQFYALWPLLLLAASFVWLRRRRRAQRSDDALPSRMDVRPVVVVLVTVLMGSLALSAWQTGVDRPWAYFGLQARAWELAAGALVAVVAARATRLPRPAAAAMTWAGLAAVVVAAVAYDDSTAFPGLAAALPVAGAALVVLGGCAGPRGGAEVLLRPRPMQALGRVSYAWYLWHWPVLLLLPLALGHTLGTGERVGAVGLSLVAAVVSFAVLEDPVRRVRALTLVPARGLALGASLSCATVLAAFVAGTAVDGIVGPGAPVATPQASGTTLSAVEASVRAAVRQGVSTTSVPKNLRPALASVADDAAAVFRDGCHLDPRSVTSPPCVFGDTAATRTMVLIGDSHAAMWFPGLDADARRYHWRLVSWTKSSCPAVSVTVFDATNARPYTECDRWRSATFSRVRAMHPQLVVLSNAVLGTAGVPKNPTDPRIQGGVYGSRAAFDRAWAAGTTATVRALRADGTRVAWLTDTPYAGIDHHSVPECLSGHLTSVQDCDVPTATALEQPQRRRLQAGAVLAAGATVVDTLPWLCADGRCPVVVGNLLVYRDEHHLTTDYSEWLAPALAGALHLAG